MIKVAHFITSLNSTGQPRVVQQLIRGFAEYGQDKFCVDLFRLDKGEVELILFKKPKYFNLSSLFALRSYDIIHTHNLRTDLFVYLYRVLFFRHKFIWVTTVHQFFFEDIEFRFRQKSYKALLFSKLYRFVLNRVDCALVLSDHMKKYYEGYKLRCPMHVVFNSLDSGVCEISHKINKDYLKIIEKLKLEGNIVLVNACQVTKGKALDQVLQLLLKTDKLVYILIGDGPNLSNLKMKVLELDIEKKFLFWGLIPNASIYFSFFDGLLFTSYSEGFPMCGIGLLEDLWRMCMAPK
jgi:glycosyltransferase involved in cell wall biosynthesis